MPIFSNCLFLVFRVSVLFAGFFGVRAHCSPAPRWPQDLGDMGVDGDPPFHRPVEFYPEETGGVAGDRFHHKVDED